jgi:hypothetical protein
MLRSWGSGVLVVALVAVGAAAAQPGARQAPPGTLRLDAQTGAMLPTRGGISLVNVDCRGRPEGGACAGSVRLLPRGQQTRALVGPTPVARGSSRLPQGTSKTLRLHLSARARQAIRGDANVLKLTVEIRSNGQVSRHLDLVDDFKPVLGHKRPDSTRVARRRLAGATAATKTYEWKWDIPVRHYLQLPDFRCPSNMPSVATNGVQLSKWNISNRIDMGKQGKLQEYSSHAGIAGFNVPHTREDGGYTKHWVMTGWPQGTWNYNSIWAPVAFDDGHFELKVTCTDSDLFTVDQAYMWGAPFAWMFPWGT